jgi:NADH dehydrogenase (ubiquinone) 1 alpha/beta subcomplex 1|uniref:NADH-ubiquinone oxidoreductase 9.6 kDa subunit n=1 Tax=Picea sitchensis TaxID=3332 RepID=A9NKH5_PICSI|nr:unknown [Picea sitchensis]
MQVVKPGIRALVSRPWAHTWKSTITYAPMYSSRAAETRDLYGRYAHEGSLLRGFLILGRKEYTQLAYSPATYLNKQEVISRVLEVFKSCPQVELSKVGPSAHFEKDLRLDILDSVEIMMKMEDEFAIDIPNTDSDKMVSCADVINYITAHPQAK